MAPHAFFSMTYEKVLWQTKSKASGFAGCGRNARATSLAANVRLVRWLMVDASLLADVGLL